ncbi:MAG: DUF3788 family protein [Solirubrobacterales bacterium]
MMERVFLDKSCKPSPETIQSALGNTFALYERLAAVASPFTTDWTHTKTSGWMLKVHDNKKALFYVIPLRNAFKISMAIRDAEKDILLQDEEINALHEMIRSARKYVEGHALQFQVANQPEYDLYERFIQKLIQIRLRTR